MFGEWDVLQDFHVSPMDSLGVFTLVSITFE
jgi:hypothetical protein